MKGFNFEKNLSHQSHAVDSTITVFENISLLQPTEVDKNYINPAFDFSTDRAYPQNIRTVQESNGIDEKIKRNRQQPRIEVLYEIAEILGVSVKELLIDNETKKDK